MLCALLLGLFIVPDARAEETENEGSSGPSWSFAEDFEIRYWMLDDRLAPPNDDSPVFNYIEQVNRLNVNMSVDRWVVGTQVDEVVLGANRYLLDDELQIERQLTDPNLWNPFGEQKDVYVNVEKLYTRYQSDNIKLTVGDSYAVFGRGLALNLNRNVDIDIDTSVQGLNFVADAGSFSVNALVGQMNRQQVFQDNPNINLQPDFRHTVAGVRADYFGPANIGVHGVMYNYTEEKGPKGGFDELSATPDAFVGGANVELFGVGGIDWYAEVNTYGYLNEVLQTEGKLGYAGYVSAGFYPGKTVWLVEFKRYRNAAALNAPLAQELYQAAIGPTLEYERATTEDSAAALNSADLWGGRVRVDLNAKPGELTPYTSVGVFRDNEIGGLHFNDTPETIVHTMMGVEYLKDDWAALINAGYRHDDRDGTEAGVDRQFHSDYTINFPIAKHVHGNLNIGAEYYMWGVNPLQQEDYFETETALSITFPHEITFTWFTDYTTNPLVNSTGNLTDSLYGAGELQWKPAGSVTLKAFYGAYKAGIRCSGGQCRQLPGFEGARFSATATF